MQNLTAGRCLSFCCPPASTPSRRAARTSSAPCHLARGISATSWTTVRSASTAWVSHAQVAVGAREGGKEEPPPTQPQTLPPTGCAFPYAAYSMPASWLHSPLHQFFVPAAAINSFLCTSLSCYSRWVLSLLSGLRRQGTGTREPLPCPQHQSLLVIKDLL